MNYYILLGHGKATNSNASSVGASGFGDNERDLIRGDFLKSLIKYSKVSSKNITIYTNNAYLDKFIPTLKERSMIMELHMDGNVNPLFGGGHVIIHSDYSPDQIDLNLAKVVKNYFGWRVNLNKGNGINGRDNLQNVNHAKKYGHNYRLVEMGHISNKENHATFKKDYDSIARDLIEAFTDEKLKTICPCCGQEIKGVNK